MAAAKRKVITPEEQELKNVLNDMRVEVGILPEANLQSLQSEEKETVKRILEGSTPLVTFSEWGTPVTPKVDWEDEYLKWTPLHHMELRARRKKPSLMDNFKAWLKKKS